MDETSPLLASAGPKDPSTSGRNWRSRLEGLCDVESRIMAVGFLLCLAFSYTQVPLIYAFHLMSCDEYYDHHPPFEGPESRRCSLDAIASETAKQASIVGMSTTICGTVNLFMAGWTVKKIGPRAALMVQTFVPAFRVFIQLLGIIVGKGTGILIVQLSQIITVTGGPAGYILVTNIIAGEIVEPARRTAIFGMLQGSIMLGQGLGYLAGGIIGEAFSVRAPFVVSFFNFFLSGFFVWVVLPYISPESMNDNGKSPTSAKKSDGFFAPLRVLSPQKVRTASGMIKMHYGVLFLCAGIFIGVLATDYAPLLIQMYAIAVFEFGQADNGRLMSEFSLMRSVFLILIFPRIIAFGRLRWRSEAAEASTRSVEPSPSAAALVRVNPDQQTQTQNAKHHEIGHFDLVFLRWSLVVDGLMTTVAALATKKWHLFVAAALLPFGSGSAPAAKGVITNMCPESQRADALNAVTLVENIARLSTQGLFGFIFSSFAAAGKAYATFYCNAAIAFVGMAVLLFSHFPESGSTLVEAEKEDDGGGGGEEAVGLLVGRC